MFFAISLADNTLWNSYWELSSPNANAITKFNSKHFIELLTSKIIRDYHTMEHLNNQLFWSQVPVLFNAFSYAVLKVAPSLKHWGTHCSWGHLSLLGRSGCACLCGGSHTSTHPGVHSLTSYTETHGQQ